MSFNNKVVFITGAASGIGRACAEAFAEQGARLYLADINEQGLSQTVSDYAERQQRVLDVIDSAACQAAIDDCVEQYGQLDVLCNIAGIVMATHFHETTDEQWQRVMNINLNSVFYLSRAAIPHLKNSGGNIVNMASSAGLLGQAYTSAYCSAKAAVVNLSRSLALEYAEAGIRVNAICPGGVKTNLSDNFSVPQDADFKLFERVMPLLPMPGPEPIAEAVLYLASDKAAYITGTTLSLDGGQTAG